MTESYSRARSTTLKLGTAPTWSYSIVRSTTLKPGTALTGSYSRARSTTLKPGTALTGSYSRARSTTLKPGTALTVIVYISLSPCNYYYIVTSCIYGTYLRHFQHLKLTHGVEHSTTHFITSTGY